MWNSIRSAIAPAWQKFGRDPNIAQALQAKNNLQAYQRLFQLAQQDPSWSAIAQAFNAANQAYQQQGQQQQGDAQRWQRDIEDESGRPLDDAQIQDYMQRMEQDPKLKYTGPGPAILEKQGKIKPQAITSAIEGGYSEPAEKPASPEELQKMLQNYMGNPPEKSDLEYWAQFAQFGDPVGQAAQQILGQR
jgi:hypothetical protein